MKLNRREFIMTTAVAATASALNASAANKKNPNLLIIHTDEHNFRTLGCYGGKIVGTPNIDWLAENGALCTSFYATTPVCSPSRASFVSGRYPQNTPVETNNIPMDDSIITFAEILRRSGYATGYAGKWHIDGTGKPQWEPEREFGFQDNRYMFNRGHYKKMEDTPSGPRVAARNKKGEPDYAVDGADEKSFTTDWLADKTVDFIEEHKGGPFCYMVSIPDPHGPNTVRAPYNTMYSSDSFVVPASMNKSSQQTPNWAKKDKGANEEALRRFMPQYWGMVKCIDDNVGKILKVLRKNKLMDNTIIVFTADHGDLCGEHDRLNKGVPYEGSAKIPFVMYYPDKIKAGTVVNEALGCVDFLPTTLKLMGIGTLGTEDGRDASKLFTGKKPADWKDITFIRSTGGSWVAAITQRYKIVYSPQEKPWLFDLKKDPNELTNLIDNPEYRDVAKNLTAELDKYFKTHDSKYANQPEVTAAVKAVLNA